MPVQRRTLDKISETLSTDEKFIILCAPTGSGKSFISKTVGNTARSCPPSIESILRKHETCMLDGHGEYVHEPIFLEQEHHGACILTITKALQDQYLKFFPELPILKGKVNYTSGIDPQYDVETEHAVIPRRILETHQLTGNCPYCNARDRSVLEPVSILNYKMFLAMPDFLRRKQILICDEASELEEELVQRFSCSIDYKVLRKLQVKHCELKTENAATARLYVNQLYQDVDKQLQTITNRCRKGVSESNQIKLKGLKTVKNSLSIVNKHWYDCEYVVERTNTGVNLTPLKVNNLSPYLFASAEKVILQSATIINHKLFASSLGIPRYKYIEAESTFDPARSPIFVSTKHKLNYKNMYKVLPRVTEQIKDIVKSHHTDKGIIHTHSHKITKVIQDVLRTTPYYDRFLFREEGVDNEQLIKQHTESDEPTILVSPSLTYGVDLKDDLARFQIIVKLPYSPLGSKRIKQLFEESKEWYQNEMLNSLIQATGRATRSDDDYSVTYILDGTLKNILTRGKHNLPKHFLNRFM